MRRTFLNQPIGVIDSGVGGLTVAREIMRQLPKEKIVYLGDNQRCPYGPRPVEEVRSYTWQMIRYLLKHHSIKMLVIACNTATAAAYEQIKKELNIPVIGVIRPGARSALKVSRSYHIGVIGTFGTIKSNAYQQALLDINNESVINSLACPEFVPLVEANNFSSPEAYQTVAERLNILKSDAQMDTLILGCTHYPILRPLIQKAMGSAIKLIDSGEETALEVSTVLYHKNLTRKDRSQPVHQFYTTGSAQMMEAIGGQLLGYKPEVRTVRIDME
ncbi:glutamate racemase [Sporolactobacillus laevolacticus]|uniref:glutamate racemase n=1 Tax=Sporolactobacillus laevolacticus TaxID=33018 RepID=UPI0004CFD47C|nr:glutamate racemase [Sporolactobacillus laevolacticus]